MMNDPMVQGNLALAPRPQQRVPEQNAERRTARFTVIDGGASACAVGPAETAYRLDAVPAPRRSVLRLAALAAVLAITLVACASVFAVRSAAYERAVATAPRAEVVVARGESLWGIAQEHPIAGLSTQQTVDVLMEWNGLSAAGLQPGQTLTVARS